MQLFVVQATAQLRLIARSFMADCTGSHLFVYLFMSR